MKQLKAGIDVNGIVYNGDEILLLYREDYGGLWEPPHGKIEKGEHPEETCRREIQEETGITIGNLKLASLDPWEFECEVEGDIVSQTIVSVTFIGHIDSRKVVLSEEHTKYVWVRVEDAHTLGRLSSPLKRFISNVLSARSQAPSFDVVGKEIDGILYVYYAPNNLLLKADASLLKEGKPCEFIIDEKINLPKWLNDLLKDQEIRKVEDVLIGVENGKISFINPQIYRH